MRATPSAAAVAVGGFLVIRVAMIFLWLGAARQDQPGVRRARPMRSPPPWRRWFWRCQPLLTWQLPAEPPDRDQRIHPGPHQRTRRPQDSLLRPCPSLTNAAVATIVLARSSSNNVSPAPSAPGIARTAGRLANPGGTGPAAAHRSPTWPRSRKHSQPPSLTVVSDPDGGR